MVTLPLTYFVQFTVKSRGMESCLSELPVADLSDIFLHSRMPGIIPMPCQCVTGFSAEVWLVNFKSHLGQCVACSMQPDIK